jgi:hypothetical protein
LGWVDISRAYYHCPGCGASSFPYDKAGGLGGEHISPGLAMACCVLAVGDSFSQVSKKVQKLLGQYVSDKTVERVVHQVGSVQLAQENQCLEEFRLDRNVPDVDVAVKRLYIAADGTTVHEKDGWHESKIGVIWWQDERFEPHSRYAGGFEDAEDFGWRLWLEACSCGLRQAQEVVYLGDGAAWVRGIHDRHFKRATFIIDWYHASEHVWNCGKILFGQGSEATDRWVNERLALLWDGWTRKLLDDLRSERKRYRGSKRKALEDLYRYISSNEEQMRYDVFRAKGYQIGSGSVEGACKHVVGDRLKRSGMIWSRAGSSAVLAMRIAWLNGDWDALWSRKPLAA